MTAEEIVSLMRQTLWTALEIGLPFLLIALVVGLLISLFQAMTRLQEMTLTFIPKILLVGIALTLLFPWMLKMLTKFTTSLFVDQWEKIIHSAQYAL